MSVEIERKYLVNSSLIEKIIIGRKSHSIKQGYLNLDPNKSIRIRTKNNEAFLTIKGRTSGISRVEFEYQIPFKEAKQMLKLCELPPIEKSRYEIIHQNMTWEIDVFSGVNSGLIIAEIELTSESQTIDLPHWIFQEVSDDNRYYNLSLYQNPYTLWDEKT